LVGFAFVVSLLMVLVLANDRRDEERERGVRL
jgi:hypothetical protein